MQQQAAFKEPRESRAFTILLGVAGALLLIGIAYFIYLQFNGVVAVKVKEDQPVAITPLTPPPPPPPPPKPMEKPPEPTETPKPEPTPSAPEPKPDSPAPLTQNAEAQSGTDAFGIAAGSGQGTGAPGGTGTCIGPNCGTGGGGGIGDGLYRRYLSGVLQRKVQGDERVNRDVFTADFSISISNGRVTSVELLRSSGNGRRDGLLRDILTSTAGLDPPPAGMKFPQRVTVRGRKAI